MLNKKYLIISAAFPIFLIILGFVLRLKIFDRIVGFIFLEHLYIAKFLGINVENNDPNAWINLPGRLWLLVITGIVDYLIIAALIYILLTTWTKITSQIG